MNTQTILDHLEKIMALSAVAKSGSIRRASARLHISQPSLSVKMKTLESLLGYELFTRTRDGIVLTPSGKKVLAFVNDVTEAAEDLRTDLEITNDVIEGEVSIGLYDSIARYFWPRFYKRFSQKYPGIQLTVSTGRSKAISSGVRDREIDIGIVIGQPPSKDHQVDSLYTDSFSCFCSQNFAETLQKKQVSGKSFFLKSQKKKVPLIFFQKAFVGHNGSLGNIFNPDLLSHFLIHPVENFEIARAFCLEGIGLAILPNQVAREDYKDRRVLKVGLSPEQRLNFGRHSIDLIVHKSSSKKPILNIVTKEIKKL